MAIAANQDSVSAAENGPDYAGALNLIQTEIHGNESEASSIAQAKGQLWKKVEKVHGVNKEGAKHFSAILKKPVDKRRDEFRTLYMLAREAGWLNWFDDLVDRAEGSAPPQQTTAPAPDFELPTPPAGDTDLAGEDEQPEPDEEPAGPETEPEAGYDDAGAAKGFTASEEEWNAAEEAKAAKVKVGDVPTTAARRAAKKKSGKLSLVH